MGTKDNELERLRQAEQTLTAITENAPDYILHFDRAGIISYMNRPAPGHTLEDMIGTNVRQWMEPRAHDAFSKALDDVFESGQLSSYESIGTVSGRAYVNRISPVKSGDEVVSAVLITHDVTELKRLQQDALESERRYKSLVEASFEGLVVSIDRVFVFGNQAVADIFGYELDEMMGLTPAELATPESAALVAENVKRGVETPYEVTCIRKDGTTFPCELVGRTMIFRGEPARITGFRDLTERRRAEAEQERREERVRHAQKLETLGVLAGGIAHDFNNLLTIVIANADLARAAASEDDPIAHSLEQIHEAVLRARELTNQLLVYAGKGKRDKQRVSFTQLVEQAMELLRVSISKKANLRCKLTTPLPQVEADPGQLQQIVMNLILNASESLGDHRGDIVISTGVIDADANYLATALADDEIAPGRYVFFEVEDTGPGMDAGTVRRIFDPFFTTKVAGRGLGLAAVLGIVRAHDGAIKVDSTPGEGTRFRVIVPVATETKPAAADPPAPRRVHPEPAASTVLIAEDERAIAMAAQAALESVGYTVLVARDGEQAMTTFIENRDDIDLVLLDLTMPKKGGIETLSDIRSVDPRVPVILVSGYSVLGYQQILDKDPRVSFLSKPYTLDALLDHVKARLSSALA